MEDKQHTRNLRRELSNEGFGSVKNKLPTTRHGYSVDSKSNTSSTGKDEGQLSHELQEISSISEFVDEFKTQIRNTPCITPQVVHESGTFFTDPAFLELQRRLLSRNYETKTSAIWSIEDARNNPEAIDQWIKCVQELQSMKQNSDFQNSHDFPSINELPRPLPKELRNEILSASEQDIRVPDPNLDLSVEDYAKIICSLLDIPVDEGSIISSVHTLFQLYLHLEAMKLESL